MRCETGTPAGYSLARILAAHRRFAAFSCSERKRPYVSKTFSGRPARTARSTGLLGNDCYRQTEAGLHRSAAAGESWGPLQRSPASTAYLERYPWPRGARGSGLGPPLAGVDPVLERPADVSPASRAGRAATSCPRRRRAAGLPCGRSRSSGRTSVATWGLGRSSSGFPQWRGGRSRRRCARPPR